MRESGDPRASGEFADRPVLARIRPRCVALQDPDAQCAVGQLALQASQPGPLAGEESACHVVLASIDSPLMKSASASRPDSTSARAMPQEAEKPKLMGRPSF